MKAAETQRAELIDMIVPRVLRASRGGAFKLLMHKRSEPCARWENSPSSYTTRPAFFDLSSTCFPVISSDCQRPA